MAVVRVPADGNVEFVPASTTEFPSVDITVHCVLPDTGTFPESDSASVELIFFIFFLLAKQEPWLRRSWPHSLQKLHCI